MFQAVTAYRRQRSYNPQQPLHTPQTYIKPTLTRQTKPQILHHRL